LYVCPGGYGNQGAYGNQGGYNQVGYNQVGYNQGYQGNQGGFFCFVSHSSSIFKAYYRLNKI
jgi:hypothetical protein